MATARDMRSGGCTGTCAQTTIQRLDTLDYMRIPQLQEKCEEAAGRGPNAAAVSRAGLGCMGPLPKPGCGAAA